MLIGISDPLGAQTDRLRYWNFVSSLRECTRYDLLHQSLPFTVLKLKSQCPEAWHIFVATAPTVHGIETDYYLDRIVERSINVATAPTVHGIETLLH